MNDDQNREGFLQIVEGHSQIDGRFANPRRIDATGGQGCFSLVFVATDNETNQEVALKFYHPDHRHDAYRWGCFQREAEIVESLAGQRDVIGFVAPRSEFVKSLPAGVINIQIPFAYYALELALSDMGAVIARGNWGAEGLLEAFRAMCRAVQRLHARHISHRDLKPKNFLVLHSGAVRLSDFGTARRVDGEGPQLLATYTGPPGDLRYSAPEMLACLHEEDPGIALRADFFALGAVLFEMFSGMTLGPLVFDQSFSNDLMLAMSNVSKGKRRDVYDGFLSSMADAHPLPDLRGLGAVAPVSIVDRIDRIYKSMAALDYRARVCDFDHIFLQIRSCLLVLRNEEKFREWREVKRRRRAAVLARQQRSGAKS